MQIPRQNVYFNYKQNVLSAIQKSGGDGHRFIKTGVPQELIHFLHYIEETTDTYVNDIKDETVTKIHDKINRLKEDRNLEVKYMTLAEYMEDEMEERRKEILEEGFEEGAKVMLTLIAKMMADGIENPLERLTADADYRKEMLNKYNLML